MKAPDKVKRLVEVFDRNLEAYKSSGYKEANVRSEFIDPFFEALGWDVYNKQGYAEVYKDVITEDAIKVGGVTKAPDYCFRLGGRRLFFLEAKKPSINLKEDPSPAYQLRRYGWTAKLPLSILTDFEEFNNSVGNRAWAKVKSDPIYFTDKKITAVGMAGFEWDRWLFSAGGIVLPVNSPGFDPWPS